MLDGFKKVVEGVQDILEPINPMVTNMTEKNTEIAAGLLNSGFTPKEIQDFVDVSRNQLDEFLAIEVRVMARLGKVKTKETPEPTTEMKEVPASE